MSTTEIVWLGIGFFGQGLFFTRWLVQWLASERSAKSHVPIAFWYMSLTGGLITLTYAIHIRDPVFITGQSVGAFVYLRNLMLIHRAARSAQHGPTPSPPAIPKGVKGGG